MICFHEKLERVLFPFLWITFLLVQVIAYIGGTLFLVFAAVTVIEIVS